MIYITGDTHIPIDIRKLNTSNFPEQRNMNKNDYVIICGDFGGVWNNSKKDLYWLKWLNSKNFTTLFIDGNHENFDLLNKYEIKKWNGGKVHFINSSIIHLMRGQIFDIKGFKFFTMGGGSSIDKQFRKEGISWWEQEIPSNDEFEEAIENLDNHNWKVDYVITHTASMKMMKTMNYIKEDNKLNNFFDILEERLELKHWYFGHFHYDIEFEDKKHTLLYRNIVNIIDN